MRVKTGSFYSCFYVLAYIGWLKGRGGSKELWESLYNSYIQLCVLHFCTIGGKNAPARRLEIFCNKKGKLFIIMHKRKADEKEAVEEKIYGGSVFVWASFKIDIHNHRWIITMAWSFKLVGRRREDRKEALEARQIIKFQFMLTFQFTDDGTMISLLNVSECHTLDLFFLKLLLSVSGFDSERKGGKKNRKKTCVREREKGWESRTRLSYVNHSACIMKVHIFRYRYTWKNRKSLLSRLRKESFK